MTGIARLSIFTLGAQCLKIGGQPVGVPRLKALALLVYLALNRRSYRRDELAALFWPQSGQAEAFAYLRQAIYQLNKALGEGWLQLEHDSVSLNPGADLWVDAVEFSGRLDVLRGHGHALAEVCLACEEPLMHAIELYQGDFLAGFGLRDCPEFDQWQLAQTQALRQQFSAALAHMAAIYESRQEYSPALELARRWSTLDLFDEQPQRALMRLYALSGQRTAALRQYQECERRLKDELHIAPEPATRELYQKIRAKALDALPAGQPAALSTPAVLPRESSTIPHFTTPFIGRQAELAEIQRLLHDPACRLVSLVAPGGMGKTRLAGQVARDYQVQFPQGIYYLSLASLTSGEALIRSLLTLWGISAPRLPAQEPDSPRQKLLDFLRNKTCLLVLDNCEHLPEAYPLFQEIIEQAPGVRLLVTSRQRLNLRGEWVLEIGGLPVPPAELAEPDALDEYGGAQLFMQSARRVQTNYSVLPAEIPTLVRIIRLVEGMPLGLELAAAWVSILSLNEIAAEIAHSLDFLATELSDVPERQRSLQATFEYSWNLLTPPEQRLFAAISVFRGSFSRQAAQAITGMGLRELMSLVSRSLLQRSGESRYELHSLLQFYAARKLAGLPELESEVNDRFSGYYCAVLADQEDALKGSYQRSAVHEMRPELANLRRGWDWALAHCQIGRLDQALESLMQLYLYYYRWDEALLVCQAAMDALGGQPVGEEKRLLGRLLTWYSSLVDGEIETLLETSERAVALLASPELNAPRLAYDRALALASHGHALQHVKNQEKAREQLKQSVAILDQLGEKYWKSGSLALLGDLALLPPVDFALSRSYYEQSLAIRRELGDSFGLANLLFSMGSRYGFLLGQTAQAIQYFQKAADLLRSFGDLFSLAYSLQCQDNILVLQGRYSELKELRLREVGLYREIGNVARHRYSIAHLGEACQMLGEYAQAEIYGREALEGMTERVTSYYGAMTHWFLGLALLATEKFGEARAIFQSIVKIALEWDFQNWVSNAYFGLSMAAWSEGKAELAWWSVCEALKNSAEDRHDIWVRYPLAMAALLLAQEGQAARALEIYACVSSHPFVAQSRWFADIFWRRIEPAAAALPDAEIEAARQEGLQKGIWEIVAELNQPSD